jgi:uncharacterized protein
MTNFIPIFPLNIVVYPGEQLNLHIFELRYQQLITECIDHQKPFGIPTVIGESLQEVGMLLNVNELNNRYQDGKMDIKSTGIKRFRILEYVERVPDKLYSGAIVYYIQDEPSRFENKQAQVIKKMQELHLRLQVDKKYKKPADELLSYDIAHHVGLSLKQEYEIQTLFTEVQRLEYLNRHLDHMLVEMRNAAETIERIKLNGHYRSLSLDLDNFSFEI